MYRRIFAVTLALAAGTASAATIGFEGTPRTVFAGPRTESGFTYGLASGGLFTNNLGHPGQNMEGHGADGGGVLDIASASGKQFRLLSLDYAAYSDDSTGSQTLVVTGYLSGLAVGTASYVLGNTAVFPYPNWTTETAGGLSGMTIDDLRIALNGTPGDPYSFQAIDNLVLSAAVPEPASWTMMVAGMGTAGTVLRRRRERVEATV